MYGDRVLYYFPVHCKLVSQILSKPRQQQVQTSGNTKFPALSFDMFELRDTFVLYLNLNYILYY